MAVVPPAATCASAPCVCSSIATSAWPQNWNWRRCSETVPPLSPAYGLETVVDEGLAEQPELYFDAGDHEELVHVLTERFFELVGSAHRGAIAGRP